MVRHYSLKSKWLTGAILAISALAVLIGDAYAQQGSGGAWTAGVGSPAYLQFLGAAQNPQIACVLNIGSNCSILFTPQGTGGLNFQNGNGGNSMQIVGTSVPPGDTLQYIPNGAGPATFTASIGAKFIGTGSGASLTVMPVSGVIHPGSASTASISGVGVPSGTYIVSQTSGPAGGAGVYITNNATTSSGANITATSATMDVTGTTLGTIAVGQSDAGIGIASGTTLTALIGGGGTGGVGTYTISPAQYAPITIITALGSTVTLQTSNNALITLTPGIALTGAVAFNNNGIGAATQQKFQSTFAVSGIDSDIGPQAAGIFTINANFQNSTNFASAPPAMSVITTQLGTGYASDIVGLQVYANLSSTPTNVPGAWAPTTAYGNGSMIYDASADLFQTFTGGTTGSIAPTLASCKPSCTDGTVTWTYTGAYLYGIASAVAAQFDGEIIANQGGTAAATMGTGWGLLGGIIVGAAGTYTQAVTAQELDINVSPTGTAAPASLVGLGIYTQAAGQGRFVDTALSIAGNTGDYRKNAIQFGSTLDPNAGVGLSVYDSRGTIQYGAGLIDCSQCGSFAGTQSQLGNDAPFILKSPYHNLLVSGDMRMGYGLIHITTNGFTLDVPNYAITGNSAFSGGTGWINGEKACDSLGNCGTITQSGGVPSGLAVYTSTYIPSSAVPGATRVAWQAVSISSPGPTGGTAEGTPFTTIESYAPANNPTIGIGGAAATAINIGNSGSTTTVAGPLNATGALAITAAGTALAVTNNATVGGTLGVAGIFSPSATVQMTSGQYLYLAGGVGFYWNGSAIQAAPLVATTMVAGLSDGFSYSGGAISPIFGMNVGQLAGTVSGQADLARLTVSNDIANCATAADGVCTDLGIYSNVTSSGGGRANIWTQTNVGANTASSQEMLGIAAQVNTSVNTNGAFLQAISSNTFVNSGGSAGDTLNEFDWGVAAGGSSGQKGGLLLALSNGDAVAGSSFDFGLAFTSANRAGVSPGMATVISLGSPGEGWPANTTSGTVLGVVTQTANQGSGKNERLIPMQAANGINFAPVYFTGNAFASSGFSITGADVLSLGQLTVTPGATGVTFDIPAKRLSTIAIANGGTGSAGIGCYYAGDEVYDLYGGIFQVATVSACQAASLTILSYGATASPPGSAVTMSGGSGVGLTVTETYATAATMNFGTVSASAINIGNSGSTTNLLGALQAGGTAGVSCSGTPTSSFATKNGIVTHC